MTQARDGDQEQHTHRQRMHMGWGRFGAMIATSSLIMFFLMYQLVYEAGHATFSLNRLLASLMMGAVMAMVMLGFMWKMYDGLGAKVAVLVIVALAGAGMLAANRNQTFVDDSRFMRAMIPHHSIAINNARKARISDPRVRELADGIIESQVLEIAQMKLLLADIDRNGERGGRPIPARRAVLTPEMAAEARSKVE